MDIRARNIWLDGSQLNVNNIKPVSGGKVILSDGYLELSHSYGITLPNNWDFLRFGTGGTFRLFYSDNASGKHCFTPYNSVDNSIDLGRSTSRWRYIYAQYGTIQTSDDRFKINETSISNSL